MGKGLRPDLAPGVCAQSLRPEFPQLEQRAKKTLPGLQRENRTGEELRKEA